MYNLILECARVKCSALSRECAENFRSSFILIRSSNLFLLGLFFFLYIIVFFYVGPYYFSWSYDSLRTCIAHVYELYFLYSICSFSFIIVSGKHPKLFQPNL